MRQAGDTLSDYRLVKRIGEGATGDVWRAVPAGQQAEVAIKILPPAVDPDKLARMQRTAETIAALNAKKIRVIGIAAGGGATADLRQVAQGTNTLAPEGGVNCDADPAIEVPEGQPIVCPISTSGVGIGEAIFATVLAVARM